MWPTRDPLWGKAHQQTESEGLEKVFHANRNDKKKQGSQYSYQTKQTLQQRP